MIIGVLRWGWVEVILRVSLEVVLRKPLRHLYCKRCPNCRAKHNLSYAVESTR